MGRQRSHGEDESVTLQPADAPFPFYASVIAGGHVVGPLDHDVRGRESGLNVPFGLDELRAHIA